MMFICSKLLLDYSWWGILQNWNIGSVKYKIVLVLFGLTVQLPHQFMHELGLRSLLQRNVVGISFPSFIQQVSEYLLNSIGIVVFVSELVHHQLQGICSVEVSSASQLHKAIADNRWKVQSGKLDSHHDLPVSRLLMFQTKTNCSAESELEWVFLGQLWGFHDFSQSLVRSSHGSRQDSLLLHFLQLLFEDVSSSLIQTIILNVPLHLHQIENVVLWIKHVQDFCRQKFFLVHRLLQIVCSAFSNLLEESFLSFQHFRLNTRLHSNFLQQLQSTRSESLVIKVQWFLWSIGLSNS
mmetsp:Transcript_20608/g.28923  ORF Transcript_20608/g.28923 Transcript_20608/m.28923 type:complete len:295 (-) Transcript_20608:3140-4024(-)